MRFLERAKDSEEDTPTKKEPPELVQKLETQTETPPQKDFNTSTTHRYAILYEYLESMNLTV